MSQLQTTISVLKCTVKSVGVAIPFHAACFTYWGNISNPQFKKLLQQNLFNGNTTVLLAKKKEHVHLVTYFSAR